MNRPQPDFDDLVYRVEVLERGLVELHQRNQLVEADKAWETSLSRKVLISTLTYLFTALIFWLISIPYPFANALVPLTGYAVSTLTIPWGKRLWQMHQQHD